MKITIACLMLASLATRAEFETWTDSDGRKAELELIRVAEQGGEKVGIFRLPSRKTVEIKASQLAEADAQRLVDWQPANGVTTPPAASASAFDDILEGNLEVLNGKSLKRLSDFKPPTKYYVFYHTASWCGPCQKFTPGLVDFYKEHKNDRFEIVLITSDSNEKAMEEYAATKGMPWPHLKLSKVDDFRRKFPDKGRGIPYLVVASLDGEILAEDNAYVILPRLKKLVVD